MLDHIRREWAARFAESRLGRVWRGGNDIEIMHRSLGFAALGVTTLLPLLIVVAAATSLQGDGGFPDWIIGGIGLSGRSAMAVRRLFTTPGKVLSTTTVLGVAGLSFFGLSFAEGVKRALEMIWELPRAGLLSVWRQAVWLAALVGFLLTMAESTSIGHGSWTRTGAEMSLTALGSFLFFWWTARFLLDGRVPWRALLPGAVYTVLGLGGIRAGSSLFFAPSIISSAVSYGSIGTMLIIMSWLIGVGYVVYGGALLGRHLGLGFLRAGNRDRLPEGAKPCASAPAYSPSPSGRSSGSPSTSTPRASTSTPSA